MRSQKPPRKILKKYMAWPICECMHAERTHTDTHIQMVVLTEPVHQFTENHPACFFPPCAHLSFSREPLSKRKGPGYVKPPLYLFWKYLRCFKYSSQTSKTLNEQLFIELNKRKSNFSSGQIWWSLKIETTKLLFSVNGGNLGHIVSGGPIRVEIIQPAHGSYLTHSYHFFCR